MYTKVYKVSLCIPYPPKLDCPLLTLSLGRVLSFPSFIAALRSRKLCPSQEASRALFAFAELLAEEGQSASFLVSCASKAGVNVLPLLETLQSAGLSIGPQEFRALLDGGCLPLEQVCRVASRSHEYLSTLGVALLLLLLHIAFHHTRKAPRRMS